LPKYIIISLAGSGKWMDLIESIIDRETVVTGKIVSLEKLKVELPDGRRADREVVRHPGGCVIIPMDDGDNIYLVKQFRVAFECELLELPAGKLDKGEDPMECAKRELKEETGITAGAVRHITSIYPSPGFCNEVIHVFYAKDIVVGSASPDEGEYVQLVKMPLTELLRMVWDGRVKDAKTVVGALIADRIAAGGLNYFE
jgi:ADP-ribose pyrophosphatase